MSHVLPDADPKTLERTLRRNVGNLARCWVDVMEMRWRPRQTSRRLDIVEGFEHYAQAQARGRGVVAVSMHFGNWETGLAAWNFGGGHMALLAEEIKPTKLFERLVSTRHALGIKVIPIDAAAMRGSDARTARRVGARAMREVLKHLRAGNTIAIAIDRDITGGGEMLRFFGADAPIPVGTVDVAIRTGAAVVPVSLMRKGRRVEGRAYPEIVYDPEAPRETEVRRIAAEVLALFEREIRAHPEMWHVLEPIWQPTPDLTP